MRSEQVNELMAALAKAQGMMKNPATTRTVTIKPREGAGYQFSYAELHAVYDAIKEPFASNGLAYTHTIEDDRGTMVLSTMIFHSSGQYIGSVYPLPRNGDPKGFAGAVTYGKRCTITALAGLAGEEDKDAEPENEVAPEPRGRQEPQRGNQQNNRNSGAARGPAPRPAAGGPPPQAGPSPGQPEGGSPPAAEPRKAELTPRQQQVQEFLPKQKWRKAEVVAYIKTVYKAEATDALSEGQYQALLDVMSTFTFTDAMNDYNLRTSAAKPKEEAKPAPATPTPVASPEPSLGRQILERHVGPTLPSAELDPLNPPTPYPTEPGSEG